ncbi:DUF4595 domain-containing protein [Sphingobacterium puteale]|uniref:DUF4595 domain-containing protein n=1 Tax=Sphingobacterium puteale TaxID=2420510 RepID=A0A420VSF4_9SPHI|nr:MULTISPECIES: DUF4595 domain-containing protein [Sphingobacterium]QIH34777.1 DUF4595 domain-containing protein [Sphingobacterium sp. DR205]RKO69197.1 DUF4595 domain-containing protein [Sphingobacterium puteale]
MMFKINSYILTSLAIALLFISCSEDNPVLESELEPKLSCRVNFYTRNWYMGDRSGNPAQTPFSYDAQGRVILAPVGSNQISFEYYEDKVILKYAGEAPNTVTDYYSLNEKGLITHLRRKWMAPWETEIKDYLVLDFVYNEQGYLTRIKEEDKEVLFSYEDGNLVNIHDGLNGNDEDIKLTYYANTDFSNLPIHSTAPIYHINSLHRTPTPIFNPVGMAVLTSGGYFGKFPKNRIKTIGTYELLYESDDKNNISKLTEVNSAESIDSAVYHIEHTCF